MYRRSQLIQIANKKGYDIKNNDISWCIEMGLIHPGEFTKAMFSYDENDLLWVKKLGELKRRGLKKSVVQKILQTDTLDIVTEMIERAKFYDYTKRGE